MNTNMKNANENATNVAEIKKELTSIYNEIKDMREKGLDLEGYQRYGTICNNVELRIHCNDWIYKITNE